MISSQLTRNVVPAHFREVALYVHWPFCSKICPYCNFNKYPYFRSKVNSEDLAKCLVLELQTLAGFAGLSKVTSVFFGGGTPSLAPPSTIESIVNLVRTKYEKESEMEISLEANPSSSAEKVFRELKTAGINRLSIGVQALIQEDLKVLGRDHTVTDALKSIDLARQIFDDKVSVDLMFGRPKQSLKSWEKELSEVVTLGLSHVSLYHLTMERSTPMEKLHRTKKLDLPSEDEAADMYLLAVKMLADAGLSRYEVANFAKKGHECHHNQTYWSGGQYLGIGPGAHGRLWKQCQGNLLREESIQILEPTAWVKEVCSRGHGSGRIKMLSKLETLEELLMLGLRTKRGVLHEHWNVYTRNSVSLKQLAEHPRLRELMESGFLIIDNRSLRASEKGLVVVDSIIAELCLTLECVIDTTTKEK